MAVARTLDVEPFEVLDDVAIGVFWRFGHDTVLVVLAIERDGLVALQDDVVDDWNRMSCLDALD